MVSPLPSEADNYFLDRDGSLVFVSTTSQKTSPIGKEMKGSALLPWNFAKINYLLLTGRWLQMNEFSGSKTSVKDALITENNTVALGAALFCTMQVASFQGYADLDFELIQENWGQTFADRFKQCSLPLMLSAGVLSVLSVLYCIMMLMVIGELSGDAEVERLAAKRGVAMNGGFLLFFFSLIVIAGYWCLFCLAYTGAPGASAAIFVVFFGLGVGIFLVFPGFMGLLKDLHNVKAETQQQDRTFEIAPLVLEREEIQAYIVRLAGLLGDARMISPNIVESYILHEKLNSTSGRRRLSWMSNNILEEEMKILFDALCPEKQSILIYQTLRKPTAPKESVIGAH